MPGGSRRRHRQTFDYARPDRLKSIETVSTELSPPRGAVAPEHLAEQGRDRRMAESTHGIIWRSKAGGS